jgi:hypothetical protein
MSTTRRPGRSDGARISESKAALYKKQAELRAQQEAELNKQEITAKLAEPKPTYPSGRKSPKLLRFNAADLVESRIEAEDPSPRIIQTEQSKLKK